VILYLDTSALVKRYFLEPYTDVVLSRWSVATWIVTSQVAYAETMASIYRKKREDNFKTAVMEKVNEECEFLCFDERLVRAAEQEGPKITSF